MHNNKYVQIINHVKNILQTGVAEPCLMLAKARAVVAVVPSLSINKKILSPYLQILKRFRQLLLLEELEWILQRRPQDVSRIVAAIIAYADGHLPIETALIAIRGENSMSCLICLEPVGLVDSQPCVGKTCAAILHGKCLNTLRSHRHTTCPGCRAPISAVADVIFIRPVQQESANLDGYPWYF